MNSFKLSKCFYTAEMMIQVANAFSGICRLDIKEESSFFKINVLQCEASVDLLKKEFENYAIGLSGRYGF